MVEVFTAAIGQNAVPARNVSDDIRLTAPSDVYFGDGVPGVAYFEKSGADLRVTLLDGEELTLRNFFVIGPAGEYSRLRDGGSDGPIEVTGLIAPEPIVPPSEVVVEVVQTEKLAEATSDQDMATPPTEARDTEAPAAAGAGDTAEVGDASSVPPTVGGYNTDLLFFGVASLPVAATIFTSGGKKSSSSDPVARMPEPSDAPVEDAARGGDAGQDDAPAPAAMQGDVAAMLTALFDGHASGAGDAGAGPQNILGGAAFDDGDFGSADQGGVHFGAAFLDDLIYYPVEG